MVKYHLNENVRPTIGDAAVIRHVGATNNLMAFLDIMKKYIVVEEGTVEDIDYDELEKIIELIGSRFNRKNPNSKGQ